MTPMPVLPVQLRQIVLELGAELGVGDVVDEALDAAAVPHGQAAAPRAEVGVVVGPVEQIANTVLPGSNTEETAHDLSLLLR